jgi:hypothetical protein
LFIEKLPRKAQQVWHLVAKALKAKGKYGMKRRSTDNEPINIAAELRREMQAECLIAGAGEAWMPRSQMEDNSDGTYTTPSWLAKDKGSV